MKPPTKGETMNAIKAVLETWQQAVVDEDLEKIMSHCKKHNVPCGDHVVQPDKELLEERIHQGYKLIAFGTDGVFLSNFSQFPRFKQ